MKAFDRITEGVEPEKEWMAPYLTDLVDKSKAARAAHPEKTVCVTFALYTEGQRNLIRELSGEPVTFV